MFIWMLALAVIWHHTSSAREIVAYWLQIDPLHTPAVVVACVIALIAACYPSRSWIVGLLALTETIVVALRMPFVPTHAFMEMVMFFGVFICYLGPALRHRTFNPDMAVVYQNFAPLGRWLLIVMYFFGTFHKINPVFLSPATSCAIPFLDGLPFPTGWHDSAWLQYSAIYGTLIIGFAAMVMLLTRRFKYLGVLTGVSLHLMIGISAFGTLAHFSTFALALHCLFLPDDAFSRFVRSRYLSEQSKNANVVIFVTTLLVMLQFYFAMTAKWVGINFLFALYGGLFFAFAVLYGKLLPGGERPRLVSQNWAINSLSVLFFVHCCGPYIGLRTHGVVQMFSGLQTAGGASNHYIVTRPLYLFDYQKAVVEILYPNTRHFAYLMEKNMGTVRFKFQHYLFENPNIPLPLAIRISDKVYEIDSEAAFQNAFPVLFQPNNWFERFYLDFRHTDLVPPTECRH
jgi:hypothetical protein